jgi:alpha-galactosidase
MNNAVVYIALIGLLLGLSMFLYSCADTDIMTVDGDFIRIELNDKLHSRVVAKHDGDEIILGTYFPSEYIRVDNTDIKDFSFIERTAKSVNDHIGRGRAYVYKGEDDRFRKEVSITIYNDFPALAVYSVSYFNISDENIVVDGWVNNRYRIDNPFKNIHDHPFWTFQSGTYSRRPDWVLPIAVGFAQQNYMGMNASDYGGGTPVVDIWRPDVGIAVGHIETVQKLVSLPVTLPDRNGAFLSVEFEEEILLKPGDELKTFSTFVGIHRGDYSQILVEYRRLMERQGIVIKEDYAPDSYEPQWCAWGYERDFTMEQIYGTLPMLEQLGYHWVVLDYGWDDNVGDWGLHPDKYPAGDEDMIAFVNKVHSRGFRSKLWWLPLGAHPESELIKNNPEYLLLNEDGSTRHISFFHVNYLCPAYEPVQENIRNHVRRFMELWGYHGLKLDGMHLNAAPPCYNPAHNHEYPEESVEAIPQIFKIIYETAHEIIEDPLIELCPCGAMYNFFSMPYMTQGVASDPTSSWQVRHKGKTFKALMGPSTPYFGDHVELTSGGDDFASQVGIGAVIGSKFTWPVGAMPGSSAELTSEREQKWAKWSQIYNQTRLAEGTYLIDLYDIGFDRPETHAILKDDIMYYAFYSDQLPERVVEQDQRWTGGVELRGLKNRNYKIIDYVHDREIGIVKGPNAQLDVDFSRYLLVKAVPQ